MTRFEIPERHVSALRYLAVASEDIYSRLHSALADGPVRSRAEVEERIRTLLPDGPDTPHTGVLVGAILSLCAFRSAEGDNVVKFAAELAADEEFDLSVQQRPTFVRRLEDILTIAPLTNLAKAANLISENANLFGQGRVITDIRPVFPDDAEEAPVGAIILHTLKVDFICEQGFDAVFFAMDDVDLLQLRRAADRALEKSANLRQVIERAGLVEMQPLRDDGEEETR
jgi:hypothetical protein